MLTKGEASFALSGPFEITRAAIVLGLACGRAPKDVACTNRRVVSSKRPWPGFSPAAKTARTRVSQCGRATRDTRGREEDVVGRESERRTAEPEANFLRAMEEAIVNRSPGDHQAASATVLRVTNGLVSGLRRRTMMRTMFSRQRLSALGLRRDELLLGSSVHPANQRAANISPRPCNSLLGPPHSAAGACAAPVILQRCRR